MHLSKPLQHLSQQSPCHLHHHLADRHFDTHNSGVCPTAGASASATAAHRCALPQRGHPPLSASPRDQTPSGATSQQFRRRLGRLYSPALFMAGGGAVSGSPAPGPGGISEFAGGTAGSSDGMVGEGETRARATATAVTATTAAGASVRLDVDVPNTVEHNGEVRRGDTTTNAGYLKLSMRERTKAKNSSCSSRGSRRRTRVRCRWLRSGTLCSTCSTNERASYSRLFSDVMT